MASAWAKSLVRLALTSVELPREVRAVRARRRVRQGHAHEGGGDRVRGSVAAGGPPRRPGRARVARAGGGRRGGGTAGRGHAMAAKFPLRRRRVGRRAVHRRLAPSSSKTCATASI